MARYFLHLKDSVEQVLDPEGSEFESLDALKRKALEAARDVMAHDVLSGHLDLNFRIEAQNDAGGVVLLLPFKEAISIRYDEYG